MKAKIGVGLVGYGLAGRRLHAPLIRAEPALQLRAVASRQADAVRADQPDAVVVSGVDALCSDPGVELVVIASPNAVHAEQARLALDRGKHVLVDKPLAPGWAEAGALVEQAQRAGRLLSVFHNRRLDSDFLTLRRMLAEDAVGRPVLLESRFDRFRPQILGRWREQPGPGAGVWLDIGPHLLDQALQLFGPPATVFADIMAERPGAEVDDAFLVVLGYPGLRIVLRSSSLAAAPTPRFALQGERGAYVKFGFDPQEAALRAGRAPGGPGWGEDPEPGLLTLGTGAPMPVAGPPGDYPRFYAELARAIREKGPNPVPPREALQVMALLDIGRESAASGRRLAVAADCRFAS